MATDSVEHDVHDVEMPDASIDDLDLQFQPLAKYFQAQMQITMKNTIQPLENKIDGLIERMTKVKNRLDNLWGQLCALHAE